MKWKFDIDDFITYLNDNKFTKLSRMVIKYSESPWDFYLIKKLRNKKYSYEHQHSEGTQKYDLLTRSMFSGNETILEIYMQENLIVREEYKLKIEHQELYKFLNEIFLPYFQGGKVNVLAYMLKIHSYGAEVYYPFQDIEALIYENHIE